jgi:predicted metallopeptidase
MKRKRGQRSSGVDWQEANDIKQRTEDLIQKLDLEWLKYGRIFFYRSTGSTARAYARTWGLPRLWQTVLTVEPAYIVEVISEHFDKLSQRQQDEIILHELSHIPRNFSGALTPHTKRGHNNFKDKLRQMIVKLDALK